MRKAWFGAVAVSALLASCSTMSEEYKSQMYLGEHYYRNGKFEEAVGRYTEAIDQAKSTDERFKAVVGFANAAAEYGHQLFVQAETACKARKAEAGKTALERGNEMHDLANKAYHKLMEMRPHDTISRYYLGLMLFK